MKLRSILLAGAVAALPLAAVAQESKTEQKTETTETKTVTTNGTVSAFESGRTITITNPNGESTTYTLNESSDVPKDVAVGKTVTVRTYTVTGSPSPVVKTVTVTTTTKKKSY